MKTTKHQRSVPKDWFNFINDDKLQLAIPIGPRFQADVPEWMGPPHKNYPHNTLSESDCSKWLGTVIWSTIYTSPAMEKCGIGKGRPDSCNCTTPGSIPCVNRHITEKSVKLQNNLGPAFQKWKFDQMGEGIAKLWKQSEQERLTNLMKKIRFSEGKDNIKKALDIFPSKSRKDIFGYYFNVYIPRRMSIQTRLGCIIVDTDDEEEKPKSRLSKGTSKRARVNGTTDLSSKLVKTRYLNGVR